MRDYEYEYNYTDNYDDDDTDTENNPEGQFTKFELFEMKQSTNVYDLYIMLTKGQLYPYIVCDYSVFYDFISEYACSGYSDKRIPVYYADTIANVEYIINGFLNQYDVKCSKNSIVIAKTY